MQDLGKLRDDQKTAADLAEKQRKLIIELGRFFEATVDDFIKTKGDVAGDVVMGAVEYIRQLYQERMVTLMKAQSKMYGALKVTVEKEGIKIHEPFENDGLEANAISRGQSTTNPRA